MVPASCTDGSNTYTTSSWKPKSKFICTVAGLLGLPALLAQKPAVRGGTLQPGRCCCTLKRSMQVCLVAAYVGESSLQMHSPMLFVARRHADGTLQHSACVCALRDPCCRRSRLTYNGLFAIAVGARICVKGFAVISNGLRSKPPRAPFQQSSRRRSRQDTATSQQEISEESSWHLPR